MKYENEQKELDKLYKSAKEELKKTGGSLVVWAGGDAPNQQNALIEKFNKRFSDIPLKLTVNLSKYIDLDVYKGLLDGDLGADVVMAQTMNDFEDWKAMDVLEPFKPESFSNLVKGYSDKDRAFLGLFMFAFLPQYAKKGLKAKPETYKDFLKPEFKNKLVLTPPHDDDAVLYVYDHIIQKYGESFLTKLAAQNPTFVRGTAAPAILVGQEGFLGNMVGYPTVASQPSVDFIPKNELFITWPQRGAMFKLTKRKAAARLFLAYLTSYEFQSTRGGWSVRKDVAAAEGLDKLEKHNTDPLGFIKWMRDRKHIHDLRVKMENIFGSVKGVSPLVDPELMSLYYKS